MSYLLNGCRLRVFDQNGDPLSGGKVWTYQSGTLILKATTQDAAGLIPNTNPIILDAGGEADVWLGNGTYKILIWDANNVTLPGYPVDYIPGTFVPLNDLASSSGAGMVGTTQGDTVQEALDSIIANAKKVPARQGVLNAPHDTMGRVSLGGTTGGTIITTSGIAPGANALIVTAGGGFNSDGALDYIGTSTSNLVFSGLSTNGTMYLYVDITPGTGILTAGASVLEPIYWAAPPSAVNGQFTYSITEGISYVGNGGTANPSPRVYLGQVTVAGGVVTALEWYSFATYPTTKDVTGPRQINTPYVNKSPRPILLEVSVNAALGGVVELYKDAVLSQRIANNNASVTWVCLSSIIYPGQVFQVVTGAFTYIWVETK